MIQRLVVIMKIIFRSLVRSDVISTKKLVILVNAIQVAIDNYENESRYDPAAQQVNGIDILKQFYLGYTLISIEIKFIHLYIILGMS